MGECTTLRLQELELSEKIDIASLRNQLLTGNIYQFLEQILRLM